MAPDADTLHARPRAHAHIEAIPPYKGGSAKVEGVANPVKLSANENALGCSPMAQAAFVSAAARLEVYPEGSAKALREAIGRTYGLDAERIVCGAGSDEILTLIAHAYAGPGDEVLTSEHGFLIYSIAAKQAGATPVAAPETGLTADVDALLARVSARTRIVFLANPNNPTGTWLKSGEMRRLHAGLPANCLLVIDGAYAEYMDDPEFEDGAAMADAFNNVIVTRTFSKIHGLAGLRIGWGYAHSQIISVLHRLRLPFNANVPAQEAAIAALADTDFVVRSREHNARERARVAGAMAQLGLLACESAGNFVLLRFPDEPGRDASAADRFLSQNGYILRGVAAYGLSDCLRLTIGKTEANDAVIALIGKFVSH
jgi:histidinol-phosphate aminotransferase